MGKCNRANVKTIQFLDGRHSVNYIKLDLQCLYALMKNFLTSFIFSLCCLLLHAQEDRFIYLQTENRQPFFVKFNNKILNSSSSGYLIIPKLSDGLYSLIIGFPESTVEQEFNCSVKNKDVGFIIKSAGQNQWQLLNVQTLTVIIPGDVITKPVIAYETVNDPFSTMLANAVHDSTILRKDVAMEVVTEKGAGQVAKDTAAITAAVAVSNPISTSPADSAANEMAKLTPPERVNEVKDSSLTVSAPNVVVATENVIPDSAKKDMAKEIIPEKANELITKDTTQAVSDNEVVVLMPDSINDVTKESIPERSNERAQNDSAQIMAVGNEVAVNKTKKKKSKKNDNALLESPGTLTEEVKSIPESKSPNETSVNNELALLRTTIKRKSKKSNKDGLVMMYIDDIGDTKDTIRILIPSDKKKTKDREIRVDDVVSAPRQQDDKEIDNVNDKKKAGYKITKHEKEIIKEANKDPVFISAMINSDCKNFATEEDFLKMRKKMVAENNDEDMIKAARKIFKTRCFTTEQIKNLSVLFLKDEGKYMFFDAAYPFVSDSDVYSTLEKQLSDSYYITRFRAMVNK